MKLSGDRLDNATKILLSVADAAVNWWVHKRAINLSLEWHLKNPTINCTNDAEKHLAKAVSEWCRFQQEANRCREAQEDEFREKLTDAKGEQRS